MFGFIHSDLLEQKKSINKKLCWHLGLVAAT